MNEMLVTESPVSSHAQRIEELGRVIMAYSEVTERLQQSHDQLKSTVDMLRKELSDKNRQLERRKRLAALGEMAAGLAHEIRNPLGGIQLYASILAKDVADRPDSHQIVGKISAGVKRLEALVGQVLQFSREIKINVSPMDLAGVVQQAVELTSQQALNASVTVEVSGPDSLMIDADPLLLGQTLMNLVLNAIEAIDGAGRVCITYRAASRNDDARQCYLTIVDSGPGIAANVLDRIFNPFFTTKDSGTGLGLSIVHRVIEAHDGTITASNVEGGGARFEIRI
jgi:signal transduction histidine kinase